MSKSTKFEIELNVDGEVIEVSIRSHHLLVDVLRNECGRVCVKEGCESASCGACTVLIDGTPRLSCITLAVDAVGTDICTVESLSAHAGPLHLLQASFIENHAIQCGFCTPGMLLSASALLQAKSNPTTDEIKEAICGNICRCTGYVRIIQSIDAAAKAIHRSSP